MPRSVHHKRGLAITPVKFGISFTATFYNQAGALVLVYRDGTVQVNHGGTEMGQGLFTKIQQIAADSLGVPASRVRVMSTRTDKVPNTSATAASAGTDLNGAAVADACVQIKARLAAVAAAVLDCEPADVQFDDGIASARGTSIEFGALCETAYKQRVPLFAEGFYRTPDIHFDFKTARGKPFHYFAFGAAVSEVEVDGFTGQFRLLAHRHPSGRRAIRSRRSSIAARSRAAFMQGVGWLTLEELLWDAKGRVSTGGASTYKLPSWSEVPEVFNVEMLERATQPDVVMGSKAVGEPPLMLAFSVREALRDAVAAFGDGRPFTFDSPATPERVFFAVRQVRAPGAQVMRALSRHHFSHARQSVSSRHQRSPGARLSRGRRPARSTTAASSPAATTPAFATPIQAPTTVDWRGGFLVPGFVDAHVHFPQLRIIGALGRTLLDWLEQSRCPKRRGWPTAAYAADDGALFLRALASHGTTTALVFGAHFAAATAALFEAAADVGPARGIRAGALGPPAAPGPACHAASARIDDSTTLIERYHKRGRLLYAVTPRFALSTTEAMLEVCQQLMSEHPDVLLQTHINENTTEMAELERLFPWAADYLAIYERYALSGARSVMAHNVHATDVGARHGSRPRARQSRIVPAATRRSAAAFFRCRGTSTPASRARSAPMWAAAWDSACSRKGCRRT